MDSQEQEILIDYVNHRGERGPRRIFPLQLYFGDSPFHEGPQWLLEAWDVDKQATRTFAMAGILSWGKPPLGPAGRPGTEAGG